jgi:hypothetical protein
VNIPAHIFAILERLVKILAFALKVADFIGNQKNGYHVLIVVSQLLLLVADAQVMLEAIMLFSFMTGFDHDWRCKKVMDRSFWLALYFFFVKVL